MGCSLSGLNALYGATNGGGDVWVNENRFRIVKLLGDGGGSAFTYLVKEVADADADGAGSGLSGKLLKVPSHGSDHGMYAMKKVLVGTEEELELVREEIRVSSLFSHPNLLPLLDHAIIPVTGQERAFNHEAYFLFPVHLNASTLLDKAKIMETKKLFFSTLTVLHIFRQVCAGLEHMHSHDPPYAHNSIKPDNIMISPRPGQEPLAILMDFETTRPGKKAIRSRAEALQLQEWAAEHCSEPFRAPELWNCPSYADIDQRTDIWSLGCTLYAMMYGISPFEYVVADTGGSLQLAIMNAQIKWPPIPKDPFPESLRQFVVWMLQPLPTIRPFIGDIIIHVDKLLSKISSER
ncbi:unnamed protein product [Spirodela intermedia]|uniref:non-specific serine/threonine protein kinase n=2 Tax=Spirodela intermedia TaxID=51605 RepID=A0A7I8IU58_SPIIN|nr:unnamed protein product [Spirodela intermedia]CAA6661495.1 unnamed protein product [Spirodela intermedia]CAA7397862.1 unnamed protein product [Spirodela intermedia]